MNQKQEALLGLPLTNAEREWLTGRLEMLSVKESYQLSAALMRSGRLQELMGKDREELQATVLRMKPDVAVEAINCLMTLHDYEVCHPAGSYEALGHFFLQYESGVPKEALPFVDLAQLGRRYEDLHPGLFIGGSYVIYPTKEPEQPYTGHNLAELDDSDWSVRLKIASPEKPEGVWVRLPDYSLVNDDKVGADDNGGAAVGGSCLNIFDRGDEARLNAAWDVIEYLVSPENQSAFSMASGYIPVNIACEDLPEMQAYYEEHPQYKVALDQMKAASPNAQEPLDLTYNEINGIVTDVMLEFCQGNLTVDETVEQIVSQCNASLDEYHAANG